MPDEQKPDNFDRLADRESESAMHEQKHTPQWKGDNKSHPKTDTDEAEDLWDDIPV